MSQQLGEPAASFVRVEDSAVPRTSELANQLDTTWYHFPKGEVSSNKPLWMFDFLLTL